MCGTYLNVKCLDAVLAAAAAAADVPTRSIDFAVDSSARWPIDLFVVAATQHAAHARQAANDSEYASADEFAVAVAVVATAVRAHRRRLDDVEIASDR